MDTCTKYVQSLLKQLVPGVIAVIAESEVVASARLLEDQVARVDDRHRKHILYGQFLNHLHNQTQCYFTFGSESTKIALACLVDVCINVS